jgi:hypothetical protein
VNPLLAPGAAFALFPWGSAAGGIVTQEIPNG